MKDGVRTTYTVESEDKSRIEKIGVATGNSASWVLRKILENSPNEVILGYLHREDLIGKVGGS